MGSYHYGSLCSLYGLQEVNQMPESEGKPQLSTHRPDWEDNHQVAEAVRFIFQLLFEETGTDGWPELSAPREYERAEIFYFHSEVRQGRNGPGEYLIWKGLQSDLQSSN